MQSHWKALAHFHQVVQRATSGNEIVLGERFEPVDGRLTCKDLCVVFHAETQTKAQGRICQGGVHKHGGRDVPAAGREPGPSAPARDVSVTQCFSDFFAAACAASHSALVSSRKPAPLHAFWPLQAFFAVLQAD